MSVQCERGPGAKRTYLPKWIWVIFLWSLVNFRPERSTYLTVFFIKKVSFLVNYIPILAGAQISISLVRKIDAPIWSWIVAHMRCQTNSKIIRSILVFKFVIQQRLMLSWTKLIKPMKLGIASPSKQEWFLQYMRCTLLSQILIVGIKSQTKMCLNCAHIMKEYIAYTSGIATSNPNNVSTSISKEKFNLMEGIMGASNAIFTKRVQYSINTHLIGLIIKTLNFDIA